MSTGRRRYRVLRTEEADADLRSYALRIATDSPDAADRWLAGLGELFVGLRSMPQRYGIARERLHQGVTLRQVVYHSHRVLFTIDEQHDVVLVHRVLHSARRRWRRGR